LSDHLPHGRRREVASLHLQPWVTVPDGRGHLLKRVAVSSGITEEKFDGRRGILTHFRRAHVSIHVNCIRRRGTPEEFLGGESEQDGKNAASHSGTGTSRHDAQSRVTSN